ncbi:cysteine proteinase, partial [Pseudovirgaria hyperparasitica]
MPLRTKVNDLRKKRLGLDFGADEPQDMAAGEGDGIPLPASGSTGPKDDRFYYFWDRFCARPKYPKVSVTPSLDVDIEGEPSHQPDSNKEGIVTSSQKASLSYDEAARACKSKVRAIAEECKRLNVKYYDRTWDLGSVDTLQSLEATEVPYSLQGLAGVQSVKRVEDIFENPQFYEDGATANDVCQGTVGDCWFLAAITALSGKPELLERICVDRDEKVGVYGFVFYRDGEWISEVVDDRLALRQNDDKWSYTSEYMITTDGRKAYKDIYPLQAGEYSISRLPKDFRENLRKGSNALYFSSCRSKNETWLPLLEKAYAKAHGDYQAIEGGFPGEGRIEDLTGGVATYLYSEHVLDKDKLWSELTQVNKDFLFGCGSRYGRDSDPRDDEGFVRGHAYSVLEAREVNELRLLKIRNPWGETEWNGAWSDGSKEWTPEMMKELGHTFGDDGIFWISYKDFLKYYPEIDRTRLFDDSWTVTQQWTSVEVPWTADYLSTKYSLTLKEKSPVVLVLSQPDERYFNGLDGRYRYDLHFRLYKNGEKTYIARSIQDSGSGRSCSAELDLDAGEYTIYVK